MEDQYLDHNRNSMERAAHNALCALFIKLVGYLKNIGVDLEDCTVGDG